MYHERKFFLKNYPVFQRSDTSGLLNFAAGPSALPLSVKNKLATEFLQPISFFERPHTTQEVMAIWQDAALSLRILMQIPERFNILLMPGGARLHLSAGLMHFPFGQTLGMVPTGYWARWAIKEANRLGHKVSVLPYQESLWEDRALDGLYYCDNETLAGQRFILENRRSVPWIMADMTSSFLCQPIDFENVDLVVVGCQKNLGLPGCSLILVDLEKMSPHLLCLPALNYKRQALSRGHETTPSVLHSWFIREMVRWLDGIGKEKLWKHREQFAQACYDFLDTSPMFKNTIPTAARSFINITFEFRSAYHGLNLRFKEELEQAGFYYLKGHKNFADGYRISLYNAVMEGEVERLLDFLKTFQKENYEKKQ